MSHLCEKVFVRKYREIRNVTIFLNYDEFFNRIFNFQYKIRRIFRIIIQLLLFQILIVLYKLNVWMYLKKEFEKLEIEIFN